VIRGTWFFEGDDTKLAPYVEELARELEMRFRSSPKFEKFKVSNDPVRFVEQKADGTFRQYRHTKGGDILGRKVIRGYNGLLIPEDNSYSIPIPRSLSTHTLSTTYSTSNLSPLPMPPRTTTSTASPLTGTITQSPVSTGKVSVSSVATTTTAMPTRGQSIAYSQSTPSAAHVSNTVGPPRPNQAPPGSAPPSGIRVPTYQAPIHQNSGLCLSQGSLSDVKRSLSRQQTLAAKEKLVELGKKLQNPPAMTQQELQSEVNLLTIIKQLQEENASLRTKLADCERRLAEFDRILPENQGQIETLDRQNDNLAMMVLDKEDEIAQNQALIDKLMEKIRKITGKKDVFLADGDEGEGEDVTLAALTSIVREYERGNDGEKSKMGDTISSILGDFSVEDLDEFEEILRLKE